MAEESIGSLEVCVVLCGELEREVQVDLFTVNESGADFAVPNEDYQALSTVLTFEGKGTVCCNISLVQDLTFESNESFSVSISSNDTAFISETSEVQVVVMDSDSK